MAAYKLSRRASLDLDGIYEYSIAQFGLLQAQFYLHGLEDQFEKLARSPRLGRRANRLRAGLRRFEHESHVVFYHPEADGILILRVLHQSMDHPLHLPDA